MEVAVTGVGNKKSKSQTIPAYSLGFLPGFPSPPLPFTFLVRVIILQLNFTSMTWWLCVVKYMYMYRNLSPFSCLGALYHRVTVANICVLVFSALLLPPPPPLDPCSSLSPPCFTEEDRFSLEALRMIHKQMDDDKDGGIEVDESDEVRAKSLRFCIYEVCLPPPPRFI